MKIFSQTKLLLWKNVVLRYRHPGVLLLEVFWPVLIVGIISIMRLAVPPIKHGNCHYQPRAMPSSGAIPFLQTYLCNLDNPCYKSESKLRNAQKTSQSFSAMTDQLGPLLSSKEVLDVLAISNETANVYTIIQNVVGNKELIHGLDNVMNIRSYFQNPEDVKDTLVNDYKLMSREEANALMNSKLNVAKLLNLTGTPNFKEVACDPEQLSSFVNFPPGSDVKEISASLCNVSDAQTSGLATLLIRQVNITTIFNSLKLLEDLKEAFQDGYYPLSYAFEIVAQMFETITESKQILSILGSYASIPESAELLRRIPQFVKGFQDFDSTMAVIKDITSSIAPLMKSLHMEDSSVWLTIRHAVKLSENFIMLIEEKWNGTSQQFIQPIRSLIENIERISNDQDGQRFIAFFEFLSKMDWLRIYDEIITYQDLSKNTIKPMLSALQTMFEKMSIWQTFQHGVRLSEHSLDVLSILTEKSIELRHALKKLFDSNDVLKNETIRIFKYGPVITETIFQAFSNNKIFQDIAHGATYQQICRNLLMNLQGQVTPDVYNDVVNTLCSDASDVSTGFAKVLESVKLNEVAQVINKTIEEFEMLYKGEFFHDKVQLVDMYTHYIRFAAALNNYLYDGYGKWIDIFKEFSPDFDLNLKAWEPFADMLDENFLTTLILNSFQSIGRTIVTSPLSDEFAPTIHVMSEMVKMVFDTLSNVNNMISMDSPVGQTANMITKYMPEIINGISYLLDKDKTTIIDLVSSQDPLRKLCREKYIDKMGMPGYVPLDEMNALFCETDWDVVIANMSQSANNIEYMVTRMMEVMKMEPNTSYDIEADWIQMVDYSERLYDLISRGQILAVIDMRTTTVQFFSQLNFSRIDQSMNSITALLGKIMTNDTMLMVELTFKILSSMDSSFGDAINMILVIIDVTMDLQLESMKQQQNITNMMGIMNMLPPKMKTMTILLAKAYPQFVSAAAHVLYNPEKLTNQIILTGIKSPDCSTLFMSDILMLPRNSDVHKFETFLCGLNITEFFMEMVTSQAAGPIQEIERLTKLLNESSEVKDINWKNLIEKFNEYNRLISVPMTSQDSFDLSPFNFTAIDISWNKFYSAIDALGKLDEKKVDEMSEDLQMIMDGGNLANLTSLLYGSIYINSAITQLFLDELSFFNTSTEVILLDFLGSEELIKLNPLLFASPDINAVGIATLYRLISSPEQAVITTDFEELCANSTLFSEVFVVSASSKDPADIQKTICKTITNINSPLVIEQILNRPSIKKLEDAMNALSTGNFNTKDLNIKAIISQSEMLSQLITHIATHPPVIKFTAKDAVWMNAERYANDWENFGKQLGRLMDTWQNDNSWETMISNVAVDVLKSMPDSGKILAYVDAIVDITQLQLDETSGDIFAKYKKYPNTRIVVELINSSTDVLQTVLYTVFKQPQKVDSWTNALLSWQSFCMTQTDSMFTVPPGLKFSMADFKNKMCKIDDEELIKELGHVQGVDKFEALFSNVSQGNASEVQRKLTYLLESFSKQTSSDNMAINFNLRVFNETVWADMFERIGSWLNDTSSDSMSPESIIENSLKNTFKGMSPDVTDGLNKAFAVGEIVMDELLVIMKSNSLSEAFHDLPSMKPFIYMLNSLPELLESIIFTGTFHPEKITMKLERVKSFEEFCDNNPEEIFSQAPQTSFDAKQWTDTLCSINMTLLDDMMHYKTVNQIKDTIENALSKPANLTAVIDKTEKLMNHLQGISLNERVFDHNVWSNTFDTIVSWKYLFDSDEKIYSQIQNTFSISVIQYLQSTPENSQALHYIDAILDIVGQRVENFKDDIKESFKDFPTIKTFLQLMEESPEMIETILYTLFTQSDKTAAWSSAMQSWSSFCSAPASNIMMAPPSSKFDVAAYLAKMCTIDIDQFVTELNTYQGSERIKLIGIGNYTVLNSTEVIEKMNNFITSISGYFTTPMETTGNLRLLNTSVWQLIGKRMEEWLSPSSHGSDMSIADIINQVYWSSISQIPEAQEVFIKVLGLANMLSDQLMDLVKTGSITSTFGNSTSLQKMVKIVNNIPELFEVLIYTSLKHPEKLSSASNSFMSLETMCMSSPETFFTIPPDIDFDLKGWFFQLCSLNVTGVEAQIMDLKITEDIDSIISGTSPYTANITSVVEKIENLMTKFGQNLVFNDRFLNESVWSQVMTNLAKWMNNPSLLTSNSIESEMGIVDIINRVLSSSIGQIPEAREVFIKVLGIANVLSDQLMDLVKTGSITSTFGNSTSLQKMVNIANNIPELLEVLIYTSLKHPEKLSSASNSFMSLETLCTSSPETIFTIPPDMDFDLKGWFFKLCSLNVTDVEAQIMDLKITKDIDSIISGTSSHSSNLTSVVEKIENLMTKLGQNLVFNDRVLNESVWSQVMTNLAKWMNDPSFLTSNSIGTATEVFGVLEQLQKDPAMKELLHPFSVMMAVVDNIIDNILKLENRTEFEAEDLFKGWQGMQKVLNFIQIPGILDVFLVSSNSQKFMSIFSEEGSKDFCEPTTHPSKYLSGKNVDLQKVKSAFCDINFNNFMDGFDSFINTDMIGKISNGSLDFDWKAFQEKMNHFIDLLTKWEKQTPKFILPKQWMNESYWQNLLDSDIATLPEKLSTKNQILMIIQQLGPLLDTEGFKQVGMILNSVMDILNVNIRSMQGAHYTLGSLIESVPALKNIFEAVGVNSTTLRSIALSPVKNPSLFAQLFISDDIQNDFCNTDKWKKAIDFPADFDSSSLFRAICQGNIQNLMLQLQEKFNLAQTLSFLFDNSSHIQDWTEATSKIFTLVDGLELVMKTPPSLDAKETLRILSENYNTTNLFKLAESLSVMRLLFNSSMSSNDMSWSSNELGKIINVVVGVLDNLFARVKLQNGRLDFVAVFKDIPEVQRVIKGILDVKPDPLSGLFAVALQADKINDFMSISSSPSKLKELFCTKSTFESIFQVRQDISVDGLLNALCALDFETIAEKFKDSFLPGSMAKNNGFDIEFFSKNIEDIINQITNLMKTEYIMFNGTDLAKRLMINSTRLMEELEFSNLGNAVPEEYVTLTTQILNSVLEEMHNMSDIKTLSTSLKFIGVYLKSFNSFLRSIKDEPIHLAMLLNNTEVGTILNPILTDPSSILGAILDITVDVRKLSKLLEGPSLETALCGKELFEAVYVPASEMQAFQDLQNHACSANQSVILWQTILVQANGFYLYRQMEVIESQIQQGKDSVDTRLVAQNMEELISLMQSIIGQYEDGSKKFTDLIDTDGMKRIIENTQMKISQRILEASKSWSVDLANIILPKVLDQASLQGMSKALNTANLFMNLTIAQLKGMNDGSIDVSDFFLKASGLQNLTNAYIRLGTNIAPAWSRNEFDPDKMLQLFSNTSQLQALCHKGGISQKIASSSPPSQIAEDFSTVVCSVMGSVMSDEVKYIIGYNEIGEMLNSIWNAPQTTPHYSAFVDNVDTIREVVQQLASKSYTINSSLLNMFNLQSTLDSLQEISQNPQAIFNLLKLFGIVIDIPLGENAEAIKSLSQMNSFVLMPMVRVLESLEDKGLTLMSIGNNPESLLDILSVLVDFDVHFSVIKEFAVKPQIKILAKNRDQLCSYQPYLVMVKESLSTLNLPVTSSDIFSMICNVSTSDFIQKFEEMGLTNIQMKVVLDKMMLQADLLDIYDDQFKWIDLMSSMEKLSSLISKSGIENGSDMSDIRSTWDAIKDLLFEKGFRSLFSYLELVESSSSLMDEDWVIFKQFLRFSSSVMKTINHNTEGITGKDNLVELKDALPDPKALADLLSKLVGSQNAAELLTTSADPIMFYKLSMYNSWKDICNGTIDIREYFVFPVGTNINALKSSLCQALTSRTSAFKEMLSLFGAVDMFKQLDMLVERQWNESKHTPSVYNETVTAMMQLIKTLESAQHVMVDPGSVESYLQPIMETLRTLQQSSQLSTLCNALGMYMNNTSDYPHLHDLFSKIFTTFKFASNMANIIPDLDDLACSLNTNSEVNLKNFMQKLEDLGIDRAIQKVVADLMKPPSKLECSAPATFSDTLMKIINETTTRNSLNLDQLNSCMVNTQLEFRNIISSASGLVEFIKSFVEIVQMPSIQKIINDPDFLHVFNFIIRAIDVNNKAMLKFEDLIENDAGVSSYLNKILGIPNTTVSDIMNATINQDWNNMFMKSARVIEDILCNPFRLSEILTLPEDSGVNVTEISHMLCTSTITDTVVFLKSMASSSNETEKSDVLIKVVSDLTYGLADLITNFNGLFRLFRDLIFGYDIDVLKSNVKMIDEIIQGQVMDQFGNSLKRIFNGVKPFFSQDATTQEVIHDVEKIIDGIIAIEIVKGAVVESLEVKDLVVDLDSLRTYMTKELNFSQELTESILQSTFSTRVFFGLEDKQIYTCDEVFQMLLIMNGTSKTPDDISHEICQLNEEELKNLVNALKMKLNIGNLIAKYVSYTTDSILSSTQMNKEELHDMVEKIDKSQVVLQQATEVFKTTPNGTDILGVFSDAQTSAFMSLDKLTPLMCGDGVDAILDIGISQGLVLTSQEKITEEIQTGIKHNLDDLPNEFCKDIYENIRQSDIGSILWGYVKPIMRGKILYTPDNEVTRAIIQKANGTFMTIEEVYRISTIWAKETPNLMGMTVSINDTNGLQDALQNDFVKGILEATVGVSATDVITGLDALQSNNFDSSDLIALQKVAEIISNFTSCVEIDRFVGLDSERDLEMEAYRLNKDKIFWAGIVFKNTEGPSSARGKRQANTDIPKHVEYKIRMDLDNVMDTNKLKSNMYKMAAEDNFIEDMRYLRGFIYIQDIIDNAIIDFHKNPVMKTPGFHIRQMPFPCHHYDSFIFMLGSYLIPIMMTFVFLAALGIATHTLVYDRENGQEQTLHVMGMVTGLNFISWFISTMTLMTFVCAIMAIMIKYTDIFIYSNAFIIFLYLLTFCFSSVMFLYMVSSFFTRTTLAILFVLMTYLISYLPYILVVSLELTMEYWQKNLACLASTTAFCFGAHTLGYFEEGGVGLQWNNIQSEASKDFSVHWACMMMLIDSAIYAVIGWYVRQVKPGKYGISQPWYFPLSPFYWCSCCCRRFSNRYLDRNNPNNSKGHLFEEAPQGYEVGIEVKNLRKAYGKRKVLHDLTINFYEGQISCLLGHNGAAKTTTLNMLCGILEPSSGSVWINGRRPINGNHLLGVCPQQNSLFEFMSVLEHMEFYAGVKGTPKSIKLMVEIKKLLKDVDLWYAKNVRAGELSYGMKRRLCVALAFVGGSKTVVLDEPTSGVDPHARKNIWNLISSNRSGRTILMSTHHLDEADILSDRIAILHKGRLLCCGSATFLKRQLGGGFRIMISKFVAPENAQEGAQNDSGETNNDAVDAKILSYIQTMCPHASITEKMGTELVINLPKDESQMTISLPLFFQELDRKAKDIGIASYGLGETSIEDIFLQMTLQMDETDLNHGVVNQAMSFENETNVTVPEDSIKATDTEREQSVDKTKRKTGAGLLLSQVFALLIKRFHHYRRNWRILLTCVLLPLVTFFIALGFSTIRPDEGDQRPLFLDPVLYGKNTITFLKESVLTSSKAAKISETFRNSPIGIGTTCMANFDYSYEIDKPSCKNGSAPYDIEKPVFDIRCRDAKQEFIDRNRNPMVIEEQKLPNDLYLQNVDDELPSYILRTFKDYRDMRFGGWSIEKTFQQDDPAEIEPYVWFNSKGYHAMPSFFNSLSNSILRANLPSNEDPNEYGITTISHPITLGEAPLSIKTLENDAADAGISVMVVLAFSFIPCGFILYLINERIQKEKQLQQISGVGTFMYWAVTWLWDMTVYLCAVGIAVGIVCIFKTDSFYVRDNLAAFAVLLILYGWAIIPYIYFVSRLFKNGSTAYLVTFCINLFLALATVVALLVMQLFKIDRVIWECYKVCRYAFLIFPQFCLGQGLMDMVSSTVKYKLFLRFDEDLYDDPFSLDVTGWKIIALAIFGFVFCVLTLMSEAIHSRAISIPKRHPDSVSDIDDDVIKEKHRIQHGNNDVLQVNELSKVYRRNWKKFCAVDHISFGVLEGESFGLLGVNGAGKTTTFRMLTGDLGSSGGTVMFNGKKIKSHDRHFGQSVGYCPQEGGLDEYLTASETLYFHARLKGFDKTQINLLISELMTKLGLNAYANKTVHTYSGGTKKKLALAVAMLGDPAILYLDEPTTGMDAATRRQAWKCIAQANRNGQSVVLTSHTMDECDALCSRIAIMVNGQIKCIGSPQHLKNKFGDGYTAIVHSQKENMGVISNFFLTNFPGAIIQAKHHSTLEVMIPHNCGSISDILRALQRAQQEDMIEYHSLSQTTLDSVFVNFAQEQTDSFEEGNGTYSSSTEDKSFTPRSSISSGRPPSYDDHQPHAKKDSPYIFSNPQYVVSEVEGESQEEVTRPRYVSNITLATTTPKKTDTEEKDLIATRL